LEGLAFDEFAVAFLRFHFAVVDRDMAAG